MNSIVKKIYDKTGIEVDIIAVEEYVREFVEENGDYLISCYTVDDTLVNEKEEEFELCYIANVDFIFDEDTEELMDYSIDIVGVDFY